MKIEVKMAMALVAVLVTSGIAEAQHYYSGGKAIPLTIDQTKVKIRFEDSVSDSLREALVKGVDDIDSWLLDDYPTDGFYAYSLVSDRAFDQVAGSLKNLDGVLMIEPYYLNGLGQPFNSGSSFVVGFNQFVTREQIDAINERRHVVLEPGAPVFGAPSACGGVRFESLVTARSRLVISAY